jgi:nucleotide-binding universal stress UspA family protein
MRILLAYDGSTGAQQARDLLGNLNLPDETLITVVSAMRASSPLFEIEAAPRRDPAEAEQRMLQQVEADLASAARFLATAGRKVEQRVLRGRPAEAIIAEADRLDADLIVMGSRGHGPFKSALLGSVSTEVVNASSRPVLIARGIGVHRVLVATDGTATSSLALDLVASWRIFESVELTVLSVSEPVSSWVALDRVDVESAYWLGLEAELAEERRLAYTESARAAAEKLNQVGRRAAHEVRVGDPAHQIVQAADELDADLIVTGSRPSSMDLFGAIGSVARNVLQHAKTSVLVVREPRTVDAVTEAASEAAEEDS